MTRRSSVENPTIDTEFSRLYNGTMRENARIVVDGMDGAGKSTLVDQIISLGEGAAFPKFRKIRNDKNLRGKELSTWWIEQLDQSAPELPVHDRFFYPELVYGPVLRGFVGTDPGTNDYVHRYLQQFAFLVYCRPPATNIRLSLAQDRQQWPGIREHHEELLHQYDLLMDHEAVVYGPRFFVYDFTRIDSQVRFLSALEEYLAP